MYLIVKKVVESNDVFIKTSQKPATLQHIKQQLAAQEPQDKDKKKNATHVVSLPICFCDFYCVLSCNNM
jgi:allophanate hydrolase subunit 1